MDGSRLQSPLIERVTSTTHRQDAFVKIPEHGDEAKHTPGPQKPRKNTLKGSGNLLPFGQISPTPGQYAATPRRFPFPTNLTYNFSRAKRRAQGRYPASPACRKLPRKPSKVLPHGIYLGNS